MLVQDGAVIMGIRLCNWCHEEFRAVAVNAAVAFGYDRCCWRPVETGVQGQLALLGVSR